MNKKRIYCIIAEGLCWLVFWMAVMGIGKSVWSYSSRATERTGGEAEG